MTESLWNAADDYLAAQMLAALGSGGDYEDLLLTSVQQWAQFDVPDFKGVTLPFGIVMSYRSNAESAGHDGSATIKSDNTYLVAAICVVDGTKAQATRDAKTLVWRMEQLFKTLRFQGVTTDNGSKASRIIRGQGGGLFRSEIDLWSKPTSQADSVYGLGVTAFAVSGIAI